MSDFNRDPYRELVKAVIDHEARYGWWDDSDTLRTCGVCNEDGTHEVGCPVPLAVGLAEFKIAVHTARTPEIEAVLMHGRDYLALTTPENRALLVEALDNLDAVTR